MERILFLTFTEPDGSLSKASREALAAALDVSRGLEGEFCVGLAGGDAGAAANAVAGCGAKRFLGVSGEAFRQPRYATDAAAAEALARAAEATIVVAPSGSRTARVLGGVAQRLGGRIDTRVCGVTCEGGSPIVQRWYYRQRMQATLTRAERPWIVAVDSGVFEPWVGEAGSASIEDVSPAAAPSRTQVVGVEGAGAGSETIRPDADLLFVAGAGWTKKQADGATHVKDAEALILGFLEATRASLGSSKSLVDQAGEGQDVLSFMSHLHQVGQTGASPRHPKGLATCCHGEEPHVVGWRFIKERRAVNTDPGCGWARGKADVLYVADAFEVMAKVNELLAG